jgi:hypothetical protein
LRRAVSIRQLTRASRPRNVRRINSKFVLPTEIRERGAPFLAALCVWTSSLEFCLPFRFASIPAPFSRASRSGDFGQIIDAILGTSNEDRARAMEIFDKLKEHPEQFFTAILQHLMQSKLQPV